MNEVIACKGCAEGAWRYGCGFAAVPVLMCTKYGHDVTADDGCTFGSKGEPGVAVTGYDVDIAGDAAVRGWRYE